MEYFRIGLYEKKVASLFFEPGEFVIASHRAFSSLVNLDATDVTPFTYREVFGTLRKFPETKVHYVEMRRRYQAKVHDRIHSMQTMTVNERFSHLESAQPWVFSLVDDDDIASYLGISVEILQTLKG